MAIIKKKKNYWGTWVAQLDKHGTLVFGSGHDLEVVGSSPVWGSALRLGPAWDSLLLALSL